MSVRTVDSIERSVQKANEWLAELADELGTEDRAMAWRVLRGYLQLVRDRLTVEEAAQLAAQLPHLLRGVFYEGFDPGHQPKKIRDRDEFVAALADRTQLSDHAQAADVAAAATRVLRKHVTPGEIDDIFAQLPEEIRDVLVHG